MGRRVLAAAAALVLAVVGATVLLAYARGADARALAGLRTQTVLVAADAIPAGTSAGDLGKLVTTRQLPATAVVDGAVHDLAQLSGEVATVAIVPGEPLLTARFAAPSTLRAPGTVAVPAGDEEISVQLEPERAVGGRLAAGDHVGVFVSQTLPDGTSQTHAVLHHVLVTQVQGATVPTSGTTTASSDSSTGSSSGSSSSSSSSSGSSTATTRMVLVTLAVTAQDAEPVVFGQEHGKLWLSLEPDNANTDGTSVLNQGNVYSTTYGVSPR